MSQEKSGLEALGHSVFLASFEPPPSWVLEQHQDSTNWLCLTKKEGKFDFALIRQLINTLKTMKIDIVHAHCEASALYAGLACKLTRKPIIGTYHRSELRYYQPTLKNKLSAWLLNHYIAISNERKLRMVNQLGINDKKTTTIHGGVELSEVPQPEGNATQAAKDKLALNGRILFSAGHLGPIKGHDDSIEALALLKQKSPKVLDSTHLYIAGDGAPQDYERLRTHIRDKGLEDKITLLGQVTNVMDWMQACDIFLQPSREEGFGLVFIEAGICHKPTLATQVGGIPDIIINEETGILVPPESPKVLAEKLDLLLNNDSLAQKLGEQAHQRTLDHFLLSDQIQKLEKVYRDQL
nr:MULTISPECIES: glycosyltransferase family 4 protein [unclassified Oleiphilus]